MATQVLQRMQKASASKASFLPKHLSGKLSSIRISSHVPKRLSHGDNGRGDKGYIDEGRVEEDHAAVSSSVATQDAAVSLPFQTADDTTQITLVSLVPQQSPQQPVSTPTLMPDEESAATTSASDALVSAEQVCRLPAGPQQLATRPVLRADIITDRVLML